MSILLQVLKPYTLILVVFMLFLSMVFVRPVRQMDYIQADSGPLHHYCD